MKNQTFGIEIETTGIGRERTAKAIAAHFGTTARHIGLHLDDWKVPMPDGRHWTVERDGSVTDPSAEVVSPVCRYEDIEMVQAVVRAIRAAGAKADRSCGIHIHIGLGEHTPQSLRRLVNIVNDKEDLLTMALGHRAPRAHHRIPRLQRHTPRGRDQSLHPAVPRHQRTGAEHQSGQLDAPGHRQSEIHLPVLAPPAGLHRRRIFHRTGTPAQETPRQRGMAAGFLTQGASAQL